MKSAGKLKNMASATMGVRSPVDRFFELSLLGLLTSGYLAVVGSGFLDMPTVVLSGFALLIRGLLVSGLVRYEIPPKAIAVLTLAYMGFYPIDYAFLSNDFLTATIHLVFFIAAVKILTATTNRDYFFVKTIAFLELLAACVISSSFNFFLFLALFLVLGVATFMSSEIRRGGQKVPAAGVTSSGTAWRLGGAACSVSVGILLMTGALFFLLPRTARAALQHLFHHRYHMAGFSNEVNLGEIGEVKKQDIPVMHVRLEAGSILNAGLRWRGSTLAQFDGRRWYNPPGRGEIKALYPDSTGRLNLGPWRNRRGLSYSVQLSDAAPTGTLFFAGSPQSLHVDARVLIRTQADSFRLLGSGLASGIHYEAFAYIEPSSSDPPGTLSDPPVRLTEGLRRQYLQIPTLDSRIWTLTHAVTDSIETPEGKARLLESYLRRSYGYTLELPQTEPADPLANFLFERKKGHCEYFASSLTIMLRTLGIPARVVTGFAGGVDNPVSGWRVIRSSDAHSWVEAYLPHLGWTTFDPTPPDPNPPKISFLTRFGFYADAAEQFWQDWILNYDLDHQLQLASRMEQRSRSFRFNWFDDPGTSWRDQFSNIGNIVDSRLTAIFFGIAVIGFIAIRYGRTILQWWASHLRYRKVQRGQADPSDATLLYERMLKSLKRRGIEKPTWLTPWEFARALRDPALATKVGEITTAYNELRFGGRAEAASRMLTLLLELESLGSRAA